MPDEFDQAAKGAYLLDEICPNWHKQIDPSILDITYTHTCILGQIYGNYIKGSVALALDDDRVYGFHECSYEHYKTQLKHRNQLEAAWINEITKRS